MLATKSLSMADLGETVASMPALIKSEDRDIINSYETYIFNKTLEADAIIEEAQRNAQNIAEEAKEQAELEFWQNAQAFYNDLEALKADIIDSVEQKCREVVVACLNELAETIPSEEKIKPILSALLAENINDDPAKLLVNPEQVEVVEPLMSTMAVPVIADARIERDTVVLKSDKSHYTASFTGKLQLLIRALERK